MPILEINGRRVEVDDSFLQMTPEQQNTTVDEIAQSIGATSAPATGGTVDDFLKGTGAFGAEPLPGQPAPQESPSMLDQFGRAAHVTAQGIGSGAANFLGVPMDLTALGLDLGLAGAEKALDWATDNAFDLPRVGPLPLGSQHLKDSASALSTAAGLPPIEREDMNGAEKLAHDMATFGTEAASGGGLLSRAAKVRFPNGPEGATPRAGDAFLAPYVEKGTAPVARDTVAGLGSGVGFNVAEERYPDSDLAKLLAMMGGGTAGATLSSGPSGLFRATDKIAGFLPSDVPYGTEGLLPTSRRAVDNTRRFMEQTLTDPQAANANVKSHIAEAKAAGDPMLTTDLASKDIGMMGLGRGARTSKELSSKFEAQDQKVLDAAQQRVEGVRDPGADIDEVTRFAQQRPEQLRQDRDAAALPILRQAESSGATVDAAPVAGTIDTMLQEAKRPPVRNALAEARKMLNKAGTEDLDDSVAGLYETRKAINDIIEGRSDSPTGRFAKQELIAVRDALDAQINAAEPRFGQYLKTYQNESRPLDVFQDSKAVARLAETDPRNVAKQILSGSEYGTAKTLDEIQSALKAKPEAMRGWKEAVSQVLVDKVTNSNTAITGTNEGPLSIKKMHDVFKQHEKELAKVYSPSEMNALRRAHKMLEPFGNLSRKATVGSPTASNEQLTGMLEAGILAYTGNAIQTGMVMRRLKVALNLTPGLKEMTLEKQMQRLVERMYFDPELFTHIMDKPVKELSTPEWNAKLNRLIAGFEVVKPEPDQKPLANDVEK